MPYPMTPERFWSKVNKSGPVPAHRPELGACWLWTGGVVRHCKVEYGRTSWKARLVLAHRLAWRLTNGPVPDGLEVCHRCDVGRCVRPEHLFLGTHAENMADARAKGRSVAPDQRGAKHSQAKWTDADVIEARRLYAAGASLASLMARCGKSQSNTYKVVAGLLWSHLPGAVPRPASPFSVHGEAVAKLVAEGMTGPAIRGALGLSHGTTYRILQRLRPREEARTT